MSYVLLFLAGLVAVSLISFWLILHPRPIVGNLAPQDLGLPARDVTLTTKDGLTLLAWLIEPEEKPEGALIILHGYPAERSDMLFIASELFPHFTLLIPNLRSFGGSEGTTTLGIEEVYDVRAAVDALAAAGYENIGVFGFSLGGAAALRAAAEDSRITAVASYGSYANLRQLSQETYAFLPGVNYLLAELFALWGKLFLGASINDSPLRAAKEITIPVFLSHSKKDELIAFEHAKRLEKALVENERTEFYFFDSNPHGVLPTDFGERLNRFFSESLL